MVQLICSRSRLICSRSRPRRPLVVRGRVGKPGRHGDCGFVRVRPQLRLLLPGRRIKCVRRHRVGARSRAQCRALPWRRRDIRRLRRFFWEDRARGRLDGGGCGIQTRRGRRIGPPGFDFDAAVPRARIDRHSFARMGKQKEAETKENDHGRCCDNAERDEVEQGADMGLRCRGALIRGIGERTRCFGRLWPRVSGCTSHRELPRLLIERLLSEHSAVHLASPFPVPPRIQSATGDRKALDLVIEPVTCPFRFW
jgi:hypothetical protein